MIKHLHTTLIFCLLLSLSTDLYSQMATDDCALAPSRGTSCVLPLSDNSAATFDVLIPPAACWDAGPYNDVWMTYTTTAAPSIATQIIMSNALGPVVTPLPSFQFAVYETNPCGGAGLERFCSGATPGPQVATPPLALLPSTTYWIRIDGGGVDVGEFIVCVNFFTVGQTACSAEIIPSIPYGPNAYTSCGNLNTMTGGCPGGDGLGEDYWFTYTSPGDEYISLILTGSTPALETAVSVFTTGGDCEGSFSCYGSMASGGTMAPPGQADADCKHIYMRNPAQYFFVVDVTGSGNCTPFTMEFGSYVPAGIDTCGQADTLTTTPLPSGNSQCEATPGNDDSFNCPFTVENSVWYTFETGSVAATISIHVDFPVCTGPVPAGWQFNLMNGPCSALNHMACHSSTDGSNWSMPISVTPFTTYYVMMDGFNGSACDYDIYITGDVLPVEYISQDGYNFKEFNVIKWETSSEREAKRFLVQRQVLNADGDLEDTYETVGHVIAKNSPSKYEYLDQVTNSGLYTYRLVQEDFDGTLYSTRDLNIIVPEPADYELMSVYPNPAYEQLTFKFEVASEKELSIEIMDLSGRVVRSYGGGNLYPGYQRVEMDLNRLRKGYYFYELRLGNYHTTGKFVKL